MKCEILQANKDLSDGHMQSMLRRWFVETEGTVKVLANSLNLGVFNRMVITRDYRILLLLLFSRPTSGIITKSLLSGLRSTCPTRTARPQPSERTSST